MGKGIPVLRLLVVLSAALGGWGSEKCPWDEGRSGGTENLNVDFHAALEPFNCGYLDELYRRRPELNVTMVDEGALVGQSFGRWLAEDQYLLKQEMFAVQSNVYEVIELDDPWVSAMEEYLVEFDVSDYEGFKDVLLYKGPTGGAVAFPKVFSMQILVYREDLFEKYNHSWPKTWDEFDRVVKDIQDRERAAGNLDFYGFTIATDDSTNRIVYTLITLLTGDDGGAIVEPNGTVSINNPNAIKTLQRWKWWLDNVTPPAARGWGTSSALNHFLKGQSAVVVTWASRHDELQNNLERFTNNTWKVGMVPIPGNMGAGCSGSWYFALSKFTKNITLGREYVKANLQAANNASLNSDRLPMTTTFLADPDNNRSYCSKWTIACESMAKYPDYWGRMSHRPSAGCGPLYPFCADIVYRNMDRLFSGTITPQEAVASMESELLVLLGHWEPSYGTWGTSSMAQSRIALIAVACASFVLFVAVGVWVKVQLSTMRRTKGCTIPVSALLALVVLVSLVLVLPAVITMNDHTARKISRDLASRVRSQALQGVQANVEGTIQGLLHQPRSWQQIRTMAVVSMKSYLGRMQLEHGSLVVLLDRDTREILVSSNPVKQQERTIIPLNLYGNVSSIHDWIISALKVLPEWNSAKEVHGELGIRIEGKQGTAYVNAQSVTAGRESRDVVGLSEIRWLVMYFTPEETVLGEANEALDEVLDISVILSIVALLIAVVSAVLITSPLVRMAQNIERARLLDVEVDIKESSTRSFVTEIRSLMAAFDAMWSLLKEYKSFIPKSVFLRESDDDEESVRSRGKTTTSRGSRGSRSSSKSESDTAFKSFRKGVGFNLYNSAIALLIRFHNLDATMYDDPNGYEVFARVLTRIEECTQGGGMINVFTPWSPGSILVTWNIGSSSRAYRAAQAATHLVEALSDGLRQPCSLSVVQGRCRGGHLGTARTRGFSIVGPMLDDVLSLNTLSEEYTVLLSRSVVVANMRFMLSVKEDSDGRDDYYFRPIDVMRMSEGRQLVYLVSVSTEWSASLRNEHPLEKLLEKELTTKELAATLSGMEALDTLDKALAQHVNDFLAEYPTAEYARESTEGLDLKGS